MGMSWEQIVIDAADPAALCAWWAHALGWVATGADSGEYEIQPEPGRTPGMIFVPVSEAKTAKNRIHVDLRPEDQAAEVERFLTLGATPVDVGQEDASWVVLADPEGNEFCILSSRPATI